MAFELNLLSLFIQASLAVKLVLVTLLIISFVSWWFIIEKYITFKRVEKDIYEFNQLFWGKNSLDSIFSKVLNKEKLVGIEQIFFVAYKEFKDSKDKGINFESIKKIIEISISRNEETLSKRLSFLSTAA